jgi:hypothetical protein
MTVANVTTDRTGRQEPRQPWQSTLTRKDAARLGIPRGEYKLALIHARMAAEEHERLGTRREQWEPIPTQNEHLAAPFIADGEQVLTAGLAAEADPALDKAQGLNGNVKANLEKLAEDTEPIVAPESGVNYSVPDAVGRVREHDAKIEQDKAAGKHYHDRAPELLQRLAIWVPWIEAAGFLTFIDYYLNVPLLEPWQDWLGWSFAVTVVVVIILGQTWLVRHAARSHNHAREAAADRNRHEAEQARTRRNWYIVLTAVTAAAITSGMIWRGTAALGDAGFGTTAVMIFVAAVTGLLLPTLAYLGIALDGSKVSRERDSLAADLDDDLNEYLEIIGNSRRDLNSVADIGETLKDKTFPDICNTTQEAVDAVYGLYGTVRLLIGGLSADPPAKTTMTIGQDADGSLRGYIGTSIPGAGKASLDQLLDRCRRLDNIESQRSDLLGQVDALPPHPWGTSHTV